MRGARGTILPEAPQQHDASLVLPILLQTGFHLFTTGPKIAWERKEAIFISKTTNMTVQNRILCGRLKKQLLFLPP
jgi:hypothetical protein